MCIENMWTTCRFLVNVKEGYDIHTFLGQSALDNLSSYKKGLKDHEPRFNDLSILSFSFTLNKKREKTLLIFFSFFVPTMCIKKSYFSHFPPPAQTRTPPFAVKINSFLQTRFSPFFASKIIVFSGFFLTFFRVKKRVFLSRFFHDC